MECLDVERRKISPYQCESACMRSDLYSKMHTVCAPLWFSTNVWNRRRSLVFVWHRNCMAMHCEPLSQSKASLREVIQSRKRWYTRWRTKKKLGDRNGTRRENVCALKIRVLKLTRLVWKAFYHHSAESSEYENLYPQFIPNNWG